ncbi:hypothetical protein U9M48_038133 [Paspalum notatum var. saurae]|uniref:Ubiquitin carboxyl-terminal hydrolase n=1 Tax=Paspalum notatum var. saurae TaxID=547442 RepID=A0AAQ3XBT6_PASNO
MGKKTPQKGEAEGSPRKKAPRQALAASPPAEAAAAQEVSDPMEEEAAEGTSGSNRCDHRLTDSARMKLISSLLSVDAGRCVGCRLEDAAGLKKARPEKMSILMCLQCGQHFCCGVGGIGYPFGHSRAHASKSQHLVAALYDDAARGYCFKCDAEVGMPVEYEVDGYVIGLDVISDAVSLFEGEVRRCIIRQKVHELRTGVRPRRCKHVPPNRFWAGSSEALGDCENCGRTEGGSKILLCLGCGSQFCSGHAQEHAKQNKHWFAVLLKNPEVGFCFKCDAEVDVDSGEIQAEGASGLEWELYDKCYHMPSDGTYKSIVSSLLLLDAAGTKCQGCQSKDQPVGSFIFVCLKCGRRSCGDANSYLPTGHVRDHAKQERHWVFVMFNDLETGFCYMCGISALMYSNSDSNSDSEEMDSEEEGYAIRGIPNVANTCYMNAILQCLLVLDKLRARMLTPDGKGLLASALTELFEGTSTAGDLLDPQKILTFIRMLDQRFNGSYMHDSFELLSSLRDSLNEEEMTYKILEKQIGAPTFINSIFGFELSDTLSCKCSSKSTTHSFVYDLPLSIASNRHPSKSVVSPQTSDSPKSRQKKITLQLFPVNEQSNVEKMQTVAESGDSRILGSKSKEVIVEGTLKHSEVDSIEPQYICQSKDAVQDPLQTQKVSSIEFPQRIIDVPVKSVSSLPRNVSDVKVEEMDEMTADSIVSIEDCLSLFSEQRTEWRCEKCVNEQKDEAGDAIQTRLFNKLPLVLTLQLQRAIMGHGFEGKRSELVRFKEYLDVEQFMDPSSVDKDNSLYRLAGVVEHRGTDSLKVGHYVAYVRARKLGNQQQQSSCSSSWFCADDRNISQVNLKEVLKREAYILFYERMEG